MQKQSKKYDKLIKSLFDKDLNCKTTKDGSSSWVIRGGNYTNGTNAGVFAFNRTNSGGYGWDSFRSVLSLKTMAYK